MEFVFGSCTFGDCRCSTFVSLDGNSHQCLCAHTRNFHCQFIFTNGTLIPVPPTRVVSIPESTYLDSNSNTSAVERSNIFSSGGNEAASGSEDRRMPGVNVPGVVNEFSSLQLSSSAIPSCVSDPVLLRLLADVGCVACWNSPSQFRMQGVQYTGLRDPEHKNLTFCEREVSVQELVDYVVHAHGFASKMPIIAIPGGAGMGKSETAARFVEQGDEFFRKTHGGCEWIAVATTFNNLSEISSAEIHHCLKSSAVMCTELMVAFRLIFIWLVDKSTTRDYKAFIGHILRIDMVRHSESFRLSTVTDLIARLTGKSRVAVFIDETMKALDKLELARKEQCDAISQMAQLQTSSLVLVFTSVRENPFQNVSATESGRRLQTVSLSTLSPQGSTLLMCQIANLHTAGSSTSQTADMHAVGSSLCWTHCTQNQVFKQQLLRLFAIWTGGVPRLCEMAGFIMSKSRSTLAPELLHELCGMYKQFYKEFVKKADFPRQCVVMCLLGVCLPAKASCFIRSTETRLRDMESLIGSGLVCRGPGEILQICPLALHLYCDAINPRLEPDQFQSSRVLSESRRSEASAEDMLLCDELFALLQTVYPGGDGRQFEAFDRLSQRVLRVARAQFSLDADNGSIVCADISQKESPPIPAHELLRYVDWRNATLQEIFGPFTVNNLSPSIKEMKFDASSPFCQPDSCFDAIVPPTEAASNTGKQFYPRNPSNPGFDWYVIMRSSCGHYIVVATENKFSAEICVTNPVKPGEDIVGKHEETIEAFKRAGWKDEQIVFRLAARRYISKFQVKTLETFKLNCVVSGPTDLLVGSSPSLQSIVESMLWVDKMK